MWVAYRYIALFLLGARFIAFAQPLPAEPAGEHTEPAGLALEAPPKEPLPVSEPKPARRRTTKGLRQVQHRNAVFGESIVIKPEETVDQLVVIGGSVDVQGTIENTLVVIGGAAKISGTVRGELVLVGSSLECSGHVRHQATAVLSSARLTDSARLDRGAFLMGGPFAIAPEAIIEGERILIPLGDVLPKVNALKSWLVKGLLWGRLLPVGVHWPWIVAGFFLLVYLATLALFPAAVKAVFISLEERPVTAILSGFLTLILFGPLVTILAIAVIGIPVIPIVQIGLLLSLLFGKAAVLCFLGRSFGRSAGAGFLQAPLVAFLLGSVLLVLAYMIPFFGLLAWVLATVFGLGGVVVALARMFQREEARVPPAPVMVKPIVAAPAFVGTGGTLGAASAPSVSAPPIAAASSGLHAADIVLLPRAGFWKRLLATLLDFVVLGVLAALLAPSIGKFFIVVAVAYFVGFWTWRGTTLGSLLLRLRVVRTDGAPVTFPVALVRSLSSLFSIVVLFLGFLWVAWDREKQSWHDKIAGTVVVQMPKGFSLL